MFIHRENDLKRPLTLLYHIVIYKEITLKKFNAKSDHNIHQEAHCKLHIFSKFSHWGAWPLAGVQLMSLVLYKNSHFSSRILSKYTLKRINYKMFSKRFSESYNQPHSKRVAITIIFLIQNMLIFREFFKTQSDQIYTKTQQLHHIFKKFSGNICRPSSP